MLVFKEIKPPKMKTDVFRLEFLNMVHKAEREIKKEFQQTVEDWDHDVTFESIISLKSGPSVYVYTNDQIYQWVNDGTADHDIDAAEDDMLQFPIGYTAKTVPGVLQSNAGGEFGPVVKRQHVHHPGFEARNFDELIEKDFRPRFKRMAEEAMRNAARKCGHSLES